MEEDIKTLENLIKFLNNNGNYIADENFEYEKTAIEHLIKAYKELEYKYNKSLSDLVQAEHKNKEIEEENRIFALEGCRVRLKMYIDKNYIPVSLVEEKIEELDEDLEIMKVDAMYGRYKEYGSKLSFEKQFSYKYGMHDVLQELLEKR